jgi:hypothetical protein
MPFVCPKKRRAYARRWRKANPNYKREWLAKNPGYNKGYVRKPKLIPVAA